MSVAVADNAIASDSLRSESCDNMSTCDTKSDDSTVDSRCVVKDDCVGDCDRITVDGVEDRFRVDRRKLERLLQGSV
jgi:hypothetical protein